MNRTRRCLLAAHANAQHHATQGWGAAGVFVRLLVEDQTNPTIADDLPTASPARSRMTRAEEARELLLVCFAWYGTTLEEQLSWKAEYVVDPDVTDHAIVVDMELDRLIVADPVSDRCADSCWQVCR